MLAAFPSPRELLSEDAIGVARGAALSAGMKVRGRIDDIANAFARIEDLQGQIDVRVQQSSDQVYAQRVKDADLGDYYRRRHPYVRHVRYAGERKTGAFDHGRAAGRKVELHKGVGGGRPQSPPLLPPKR